jgi:hypothetical protein
MRLFLKLEAPWIETAVADGEALAFTRNDVPARLAATALYDRFAPPRAVPAELRVEIVGEANALSTLGWPVQIIERIVTSADGARRELEVRYTFFELGGAVVVSGPSAAIARHRDELLAAAVTARPDWTAEIACIADLLLERP